MQRYNAAHSIAVEEALKTQIQDPAATSEERQVLAQLLNRLDDIARQFADRDKFEIVNGVWVLPDRVWHDFWVSGDFREFAP